MPALPPWLAALPLLLLASCASPSKSFYLLTPEGSPPSGTGTGGKGIGVGPVSVAGYLDRPNLVFQESGNRLAISESHRWAGDLAENITRVTAANLGRELGTGNVRTYPWENDSGLNWQVTLDVLQLHGDANGDAIIQAAWRIYALPARTILSSRSWSSSEPLLRDGYDELAAAQSRLLARLAKEIASSISAKSGAAGMTPGPAR